MTDLTNAINRIFAWLEEHTPKSLERFQSGLSSAQIEERLSSLPFCIPEEVRELYRWRNGDKMYGSSIFGYHWLMSLDRACEFVDILSEYFNNESLIEIREKQAESMYLFPLFEFDGEYFAIEGSNEIEKTGRIFHIGKFYEVSFAFISLTSMMLSIAECYEAGVYAVGEDYRIEAEVVDPIEFGRIRHKYNPGTVKSLYADGW
jgi:SMI1 / KNR4 family (SUKH-1)